jgi:hypothetical protein
MNQMSTGGSSTGSNAHRKLFPNSDNGQVWLETNLLFSD